MWSDRLSPQRRRRLAARLRAALPARALGIETRAGALPDGLAPEAVASVLRHLPGFRWLDGGATGHRLYAEPLAVLSAAAGRGRLDTPTGTLRFRVAGLDLLGAALDAWGAAGPGLQLVGYLAYELGGEIESLPAPQERDLDLPDLQLALYDQCLRFEDGAWSHEVCAGWRGAEAAFDLAGAAQHGTDPLPLSPVPLAPPPAPPVRSRPDRAGYRAAVTQGVEWIGSGDLFQVNLCRRLEAPLPHAEAWDLYRRLRRISPADHGAYLDLGEERALLSISPETYLRVRGRRVETEPIKGTRARRDEPQEDVAAIRELLGSEKERAELTMIVDVARNDLGRVCEIGSIGVPSHGALMTLPTVHHTVSRVVGTLRPEVGSVELLRASFPPASISGAPKIRALQRIAEAEPVRRGAAMGAVGWIALGGDLELSVAIRTAVAAGGRIAYHAGCGIVADSSAEAELGESAAKAKAFLAALGSTEAD